MQRIRYARLNFLYTVHCTHTLDTADLTNCAANRKVMYTYILSAKELFGHALTTNIQLP